MRLFTRLASGRLRSDKSGKDAAPLDPSFISIEPTNAAEVATLQAKLTASESQVATLRGRVEELKGQRASQQREITSLRTMLSSSSAGHVVLPRTKNATHEAAVQAYVPWASHEIGAMISHEIGAMCKMAAAKTGCASSKSDAADSPAASSGWPLLRRKRWLVIQQAKPGHHAGIPLLASLDDRLVAAFRSGAIKLLRADFVRATSSLTRILRRQDFEALEREKGVRVFLSPDEAIDALRAHARRVAALTYGWTSPDDPDVTSAYLEAVRRFLCSPLGARNVDALFWDYASLPQRPRTPAEEALFLRG